MTTIPPDEGARHGTAAADAPRAGQLCLDVPHRRLYCLDETARQFRRDGLPLTDDDPAVARLRAPDGAAVDARQLPLVIAARTGRAAQATFRLARPAAPDLLLSWSAAPLPAAVGTGPGRLVLATLVVYPPPPDWQALSGVAHDLATPLHTLGLLLNVVAGPGGATPEALGLLRSAGQRAQQIGRDLLEWCRTAGLQGRAARPTWFPLAPFLHELLAEHQPAAGLKGLTLAPALAPADGWAVHTDRVWLGRIVANLLTNAVRYTPAGGRVTLSADWDDGPAGRALAVGVRDTGPGISPEERESIFHPFERGHTGRESGALGSGVGLAVVDHLAHALGLQRELASEPGRGSVFRVLIPDVLLRPAPAAPA